ncbi:diguanylate phosphodiesterase [Photobacterium sanctipauli]|uniref:Diguanylate phosphodiesterase n=4 Tax=Photobacterium sanctipauli TaxID=1342794 RepID=A0A2T3NPA8_9GAMM|nr:diguanylate phosphodiesterase [Photobacterium sanctipauli]
MLLRQALAGSAPFTGQVINQALEEVLTATSLTAIEVQVNDRHYQQLANGSYSYPSWLNQLVGIQSYTATHDLAHAGNLGIKVITEHGPAQSLQQLWHSTLGFSASSLLAIIFLNTISVIALVSKHRPLLLIADYASEAKRKQSRSPLPLPASADVKAIVKLVNHLNAQLNNLFKQQANEAVKLKEQAYRDKVSGLGNRQYFINQLNSWISTNPSGGVALLKTTLIDDTYRQHGFDQGDQLVKQIAEELNSNIIHSEISLARLSYDEFAVLVPNTTAKKLQAIGEGMLNVLNTIQAQAGTSSPDCAHIGLLITEKATSASHLLTQLDNLLAQAALTPETPLAFSQESNAAIAFGKQQWKALLIEAIDNNFFRYHDQPVTTEQGTVYHYEVFSSIHKGKDKFSARQFLGAIDELGAGVLFDRETIASSINRLNADHTLGPLAINITTSSVNDPAFIRWLTTTMERNQRLADRLFFEIPEACFVRSPDSCSLLCSAIRFYKFRFGVDNYGRYFKSLDYLTEFRPDYVKIDFSYTHQLNDEVKQALLSSISRTAHSLKIMTIATRVETETQLERLSDLFVSGFQGYIVEKKCKPTLNSLV